MKSLKFSVLIPAYKAKYLSACINSVLSQNYKNFEVVIVDDKSPEDLLSIVEQFKDQRIRYYRNDVGFGAYNVVGNWNLCLKYATGDYVICMGDDDLLTPIALSEYAVLIDKYPNLGLYHGLTELIDEKGDLVTMQESRPQYESVYSMIWHRWTCRGHQYIGDWVFDAETLRRNGGFYSLPLAWGSDDISAVIAARETGVANTNTICFKYRVNCQTISKSGDARIKLDSLIIEKGWFEKFLSKSEPFVNGLDEFYSILCRKVMVKRYHDRYIDCVYEGISKDGLLKGGWLFRARKLGFSNKELFKLFLFSLFQ